jgi:hypothetical protein
VEPLVITGCDFLSDYLYADYVASDKIVLGFVHTSYGGPVSDPIAIDYSRTHRVTLDMPGLYPPLGDPYFDGLPKKEVEAFGERLRVALDGVQVIDTAQQFYPPFALQPSIGSGASNQAALGKRFTGQILVSRRLAANWRSRSRATTAGPLAISLVFPAGHPGSTEPLVSSGYAGRGDILSVKYLESRHVTFSLDHWGYGGPTSEPVGIEPGVRQTLEVRFGSFFPSADRPIDVPAGRWSDAGGKLEVILDNRQVFEAKTPFYEAPAETVVVGRNAIGSSSCGAQFTGQILGSSRAPFR